MKRFFLAGLVSFCTSYALLWAAVSMVGTESLWLVFPAIVSMGAFCVMLVGGMGWLGSSLWGLIQNNVRKVRHGKSRSE
jgi:hypothetical protein